MGQFRQILLYAIVIGFVTIGVFMIAAGETMMGMMALCFFGGCGVVFLAQRAEIIGRDRGARSRQLETEAAHFRFNRPFLGVMALGSALMGIGAGLMGLLGAPQWIAWPGAVLALAGAILLARRAADNRPVIVIDAEGIFHRSLLFAPLRWDDIDMLEVTQPASVPYLMLYPRDGVHIAMRTAFLRIHDMQLDGSLADVLAAIHHFRPQIIMSAPET